MSGTRDIVQKLWRLCDILRDDGITYQAYVTELTYLLFLKMLQETDREVVLPADYRWSSLTAREGEALLTHYRACRLVVYIKIACGISQFLGGQFNGCPVSGNNRAR